MQNDHISKQVWFNKTDVGQKQLRKIYVKSHSIIVMKSHDAVF